MTGKIKLNTRGGDIIMMLLKITSKIVRRPKSASFVQLDVRFQLGKVAQRAKTKVPR